uniref:Putative secreted protein n=1 Tax=Xenopsylla cheopis TaxID=163159 RepID=A0A6M2E1M6_XENCH
MYLQKKPLVVLTINSCTVCMPAALCRCCNCIPSPDSVLSLIYVAIEFPVICGPYVPYWRSTGKYWSY